MALFLHIFCFCCCYCRRCTLNDVDDARHWCDATRYYYGGRPLGRSRAGWRWTTHGRLYRCCRRRRCACGREGTDGKDLVVCQRWEDAGVATAWQQRRDKTVVERERKGGRGGRERMRNNDLGLATECRMAGYDMYVRERKKRVCIINTTQNTNRTRGEIFVCSYSVSSSTCPFSFNQWERGGKEGNERVRKDSWRVSKLWYTWLSQIIHPFHLNFQNFFLCLF